MFGTNRTVPAANNTRWNSTFKQEQALTALDHKALNEMCSKDYGDVVFSVREWNQLKELSAVLAVGGSNCPGLEYTPPQDGGDPNAVPVIGQSPPAVSGEKILWNLYKNKHGQRQWKRGTF